MCFEVLHSIAFADLPSVSCRKGQSTSTRHTRFRNVSHCTRLQKTVNGLLQAQ